MRRRDDRAPGTLGLVELVTDAAALLIGAAPAVLIGWLLLLTAASLLGGLILGAIWLLAPDPRALLTNPASFYLVGALGFLVNRGGIVLSVAGQAFLTGWVAPMGALALNGQTRLVMPWARLPTIVATCLLQGLVVSIGYLLCVFPGVVLNVMLAPAAAVAAWEDQDAVRCLGRAGALMDGSRLVLFVVNLVLGLTFFGIKLALFDLKGLHKPLELPLSSKLVLLALEGVYISLMASLGAAAYYRRSGMAEEQPDEA
jgi:hypothetical protein